MGLSLFEYDEELLKKDQFEYGMEKGIEKGMERGREQGIHFTLIGLVKDGLLSIHEAAKRADMSENDFETLMQTKTLH